MLNLKGIDSEVLHTLSVLGTKDCDLKTITICCNPNYIRGSDSELRHVVKKEIDKLLIADVLYIKKHRIQSRNDTKRIKTIFVYQLKNA